MVYIYIKQSLNLLTITIVCPSVGILSKKKNSNTPHHCVLMIMMGKKKKKNHNLKKAIMSINYICYRTKSNHYILEHSLSLIHNNEDYYQKKKFYTLNQI
jgi:hypothetical protein